MRRRLAAVLAASAVAVGGAATLAAATNVGDLCEISIHDHTPGTYPGGMHIHNSCVGVTIDGPALPEGF